jgi:hypothetical protein
MMLAATLLVVLSSPVDGSSKGLNSLQLLQRTEIQQRVQLRPVQKAWITKAKSAKDADRILKTFSKQQREAFEDSLVEKSLEGFAIATEPERIDVESTAPKRASIAVAQ